MKPAIQFSRRCGVGATWCGAVLIALCVGGETANAQLIPPPAMRTSLARAAADPCSPAEPAVVRPPAPRPTASYQPRLLSLQVGAFASAENAAALRRRLGARFPRVAISPVEQRGVRLYRVRLEGFADPRAIEVARAELRATGLAAYQTEH
jgi:cell division septation protein DedD